MRLAVPFAILVVALISGCGGSSSGGQTGPGTAGGATSAPRKAAEPGGASASNAPAGAATTACDPHPAGAEELRVTGVPCGTGRQVTLAWRQAQGCALAAGASRGGCTVRSYRCAGVRAERGVAVSCSRPGRAVAFIVRPR